MSLPAYPDMASTLSPGRAAVRIPTSSLPETAGRGVELETVRRDGQDAAERHRVAGVDGEVEQHLLELAGIADDRRERGGQGKAEIDLLAERPAEE